MIENGMVVGAAEEWERLNEETPWDRRDDESILAFVSDMCIEADILADTLGVKSDSIRQDAAVDVFDYWLQSAYYAEGYIAASDLRIRSYNDWAERTGW